ncbi:MarR family transcriptional regulator [Streptomyces malaysiensis subsp. malaysiensis]|uniref:Winged helix-turn-helix transcriptional regulator n=1 Tax=Streptomyces malaysiensis TaxID=92644 RepID=A0ABX6WH07_STRMQ|nr:MULTISPECIES: MarR family winged helix-turn-helix transcriptional regulator [Streptomyces]MCC4315515.1 MarR family winged helix-turn-helix transcriptional regulator [Streptomyces malaysiensis]MYU11404.1 MarR family transcriptional regulator [Streptomyces sp. SID8361]AUA08811.1 MarR family protein [Streptomyces sp. M56]MCQ6252803.1 MarR family winged helix-turn-helix transcriptional regulator [Streptomyces malaysiensis]MYX58726.1 MarR family transcriptional regulator [Streptomyces sp. SID838
MDADLEFLGRAVKQAQYRQHRALDSALGEVGTTLAQWDALRAISYRPGASARELAAATFQSEQAFGALASRLAAQGLVERSPGHGRRVEHRLTPTGEQTLAAGHQVSQKVLEECFSPLPSADRATLLGLLRQLNGEESLAN